MLEINMISKTSQKTRTGNQKRINIQKIPHQMKLRFHYLLLDFSELK